MAQIEDGTPKAVKREVPEHLRRFESFLEAFNSESKKQSDRGVVLIACSYLDEILYEILKSFLIESKETDILLDGFGAPLGTLSARIAISYTLGLLSKSEYKEAENIRKIRNKIAHNIDTSFESDDIKDMCNNLKMIVPDTDAKGRYVTGSVALILNLTNRAAYVSQKRRKYEDWKF